MKKIIISAISLAFLLSLLSACTPSDTESPLETQEEYTEIAAADDMFTDRDREIGYSVSDCETISLSDSGSVTESKNVNISGSTVTITGEGSYILSGGLSDGQIVVDAQKTDRIQLIFEGVNISNSTGAAVYIKQADKVFITSANGSVNSLSVTDDYVQTDDNNVDACIFSKDDLTLNGAGALTINAAYGHGVVTKDDLVITSGSYDITSAKTGLSGKQSVRIGGGSITIDAEVDGIHSEDADDETLGFIYIAGGTMNIKSGSDGVDAMSALSIVDGDLTITAGDDGLHCDSMTSISGGTVSITESYEGIEGKCIEISGGDISVVSADDGLNAAGENDQSGFAAIGGGQDRFASDGETYLFISGGTLNVNASGDGLDSNGDLTITGGYITVSGPTDNNNGTVDYGAAAVISGGTLLGAGSSGMAENFSDTSTQCVLYYTFGTDYESGTTVTVKDSSGKELASFVPEKSFSSVNLSLPEFAQGETYIISVNGNDYEVSFEGITYSNGTGFSGGMGGQRGQKPADGSFTGGQRGQRPTDGTIPDEFLTDGQQGQMPSEFTGPANDGNSYTSSTNANSSV